MKNLVDKKAYRTFISTCFDINVTASKLNTLELQKSIAASSSSISLTEASSLTNGSRDISIKALSSQEAAFNTSPTYLSLIIAAGFNKGEIHLFDGFKKEASVFYNNHVTILKFLNV